MLQRDSCLLKYEEQYLDPYIGILNASREEGFIKGCLQVIENTNLTESIILYSIKSQNSDWETCD